MSNGALQFLSEQRPWQNNNNTQWLASTVNVSRNVEKFKFPGKLDADRRKQIVSLISKELLDAKVLKNPQVLKAEELTPIDKEFLVEHFFSLENYQTAHQGEAFIFDDAASYFIKLNIDDHLQFHFLDYHEDIENTWNALVKLEMALGKVIGYSFSPRFGFLTADPMRCGTGLKVSAFLQLPGLIHTEILDDNLAKLSDEAINVGGMLGGIPHLVGDILVVQNNFTLGVNEENILSSIRNYVTKVLIEENAVRSKIRQEGNPHIKDLISRAFGVLFHSYQIEAIEALDALSLLKFGLEMNWVKGVSVAQINTLFFNCRRAHLLTLLKEKISQEEIAHKRAEFIHQALNEVKLVI